MMNVNDAVLILMRNYFCQEWKYDDDGINAKITVFNFIIISVTLVIDGVKNWPSAKFNHVFASSDRKNEQLPHGFLMLTIVVATQVTLISLIRPSLNNQDVSFFCFF